jgi:D-glycero-D-manno-heptose 1,7-bisphosphate phosphatase
LTGRAAAFLDRDGTIMRDANYVQDPRDVVLIPGAAKAIRRLNERDIPVIVVTNQSGIARGWLTPGDYAAVQAQLIELLAEEDAHVTATYMCPHHPDVAGPCDCRKPGVGMYEQAIAEHALDATRSVFIGDRWRDVAPAAQLGGLGIMLDVNSTPPEDRERARAEAIATASSLSEAVSQFLSTLPA